MAVVVVWLPEAIENYADAQAPAWASKYQKL